MSFDAVTCVHCGWPMFVGHMGQIWPCNCDSRSKPDRAKTTKIGLVHESGGAAGNRPNTVELMNDPIFQREIEE